MRALSERVAYLFVKRHPLRADEAPKPSTLGSILNNRIEIVFKKYIKHYNTIIIHVGSIR